MFPPSGLTFSHLLSAPVAFAFAASGKKKKRERERRAALTESYLRTRANGASGEAALPFLPCKHQTTSFRVHRNLLTLLREIEDYVTVKGSGGVTRGTSGALWERQ